MRTGYMQVMYALVNAIACMMSARSVAVFPVGLTALNHMMLHNRAPLVAMCKNAFHPDNQINLRWAALQPLLALTCSCVEVRPSCCHQLSHQLLRRPGAVVVRRTCHRHRSATSQAVWDC